MAANMVLSSEHDGYDLVQYITDLPYYAFQFRYKRRCWPFRTNPCCGLSNLPHANVSKHDVGSPEEAWGVAETLTLERVNVLLRL